MKHSLLQCAVAMFCLMLAACSQPAHTATSTASGVAAPSTAKDAAAAPAPTFSADVESYTIINPPEIDGNINWDALLKNAKNYGIMLDKSVAITTPSGEVFAYYPARVATYAGHSNMADLLNATNPARKTSDMQPLDSDMSLGIQQVKSGETRGIGGSQVPQLKP